MVMRPILSEIPPQKKRPRPLKIELTAIRVAPARARPELERGLVGLCCLSRSWYRGDWKEINIMPATTFIINISQMIMKGLERMCFLAEGCFLSISSFLRVLVSFLGGSCR